MKELLKLISLPLRADRMSCVVGVPGLTWCEGAELSSGNTVENTRRNSVSRQERKRNPLQQSLSSGSNRPMDNAIQYDGLSKII